MTRAVEIESASLKIAEALLPIARLSTDPSKRLRVKDKRRKEHHSPSAFLVFELARL
jgi:hypothetical protein